MHTKSNILLVDDDELYLFLMERTIHQISNTLKVGSFTDGERAIEYITQCTNEKTPLPEVIFLDINMPFLDGWGFLAEFKKLKPQISNKVNIYMVSSSMREFDKKRAANLEELTGYVIKPVDKGQLIEIFKTIYQENW
ncbi:Response regulator receiver domain-containing protein [Maribacter sedimenticola]|uniref:Response regulator receiver domain-containing protein n=1 Tax=Maribacter sedimenticola TaxID=228956 RepID=A0ABY1SKU7_9FLAO|nr:response regulator [Maribacter sedimenticola]SNR69830.1 Response regulator receiver domain-containing protein [Maribacter sedimenticola]